MTWKIEKNSEKIIHFLPSRLHEYDEHVSFIFNEGTWKIINVSQPEAEEPHHDSFKKE